MSVLLIAEAGVNHNGDEDTAHALIDAARNAGADAVKFQAFNAARLVTAQAHKAPYQRRDGESVGQLEMLQALELPPAAHKRLARHSRESGLEYLCSAFDDTSLDFVCDDLDLVRLKIGSGELNNLPFLHAHARQDRDIILSTGMGTLGEIDDALATIAHGFIAGGARQVAPNPIEVRQAYASEAGRDALQRRVVLLHCTTEYPAPPDAINLRAMTTMANAFGLPVGYSDHSESDIASICAVATGAVVIERHLTLDRGQAGPDHAASCDPDSFARFCRHVRETEIVLGSATKGPSASELANIPHARKSVVAARDLHAGDIFDSENLMISRPGTGLEPRRFWELLGGRADRAYKFGEQIEY